MAPNKFEENIKHKLEKRTIQPSSGAWNQLENQLGHSEKKGKAKSFLWLGVAASVIGVLLVVSQFLKTPKEESKIPVIVETPQITNEEKPNQVIAKETKTEEGIETQKPEPKKNPADVKTAFSIEPGMTEMEIVTNEMASKETKNLTEKELQPIELTKQALSIEDQKIKDVVAQVRTLKENHKTITDADIEALLQQAQKEIRNQQLYNEKTEVVDAKLLLQDIEADLDKSFRDKVFEALKANFKFAKTALAQRNN